MRPFQLPAARIFAVIAALFAFTHGGIARAASIAIPTAGTAAPAVDLFHQGKLLDRDEAMDLAARGVDLSTLDPAPNDAWQPRQLPTSPEINAATVYPADGSTLLFDALLPAANGLLRARLLADEEGTTRPFQLMMSLGTHAALARNALLRKLGYPIPVPRYYRTLTVRFSDNSARERFLDSLSDATLTARSRWIRSAPEGSAEVTLQDLALEPAQINVPMYHWGIIPASHLQGRRALRALIIPLVLLDVQESVNLYSWELGKNLNNSIILTHPYASSFAETTVDDARWIARRITQLTRQDLEEIVAQARYPDDVGALVTEKLVARRNHLIQLFNLPAQQLRYNPKLDRGAVKRGKLTRSIYDGYAPRFSYGDPLSPLRASEITRYFMIKGIGAGLNWLTSEMDRRLLTIRGIEDLATKHQQDIARDISEHFQKNPGAPYSRPISAWGGPVAGFGVTLDRNVVTGTYYGSDSKIQLVDNFGIRASLGFFMGIDGIPNVLPSMQGNVTVQRNFLHVKPLADMKTALKTDWRGIFVPSSIGKLTELISSDTETGLEPFLDALQDGEMFVITDSIAAGANANVHIPIPLLLLPNLAFLNPSMGVGAGTQAAILRRTTLIRVPEGVQIYIQDAKILSADVEFNFNWWINILRLSRTKKLGKGDTSAFLLDQEKNSDETRRKMALSLRALLAGNNPELLEENFGKYRLRHDLTAGINRARLLAWKFSSMDEDHRVRVQPPDYPDKERTLFSSRIVRTRGIDIAGLLSDVLKTVTNGLGQIDLGTKGSNPSDAFLGRGFWKSVVTEAELTPGYDQNAVTVIERHIGGWHLSRAKLMRAIEQVEAAVRPLNLNKQMIRRDEFATTKALDMYDILSTLIIYEEGMKRISDDIFAPRSVVDVVRTMIAIEGREDLDRWCSKPSRRIKDLLLRIDTHTETENGKRYTFLCLKPWMKQALRLRRKLLKKPLSSPEAQIRWTNRVLSMLEREMELAKLLRWIDRDDFFFQIRVSGFRTQDENGDAEYLSDSIGTFNERSGAGAFREFAAKYGIMANELYARYLSDGY